MTNLYTNRDKMTQYEANLPIACQSAVNDYHHDLNAHGRSQPRGHRTDVTPTVLVDRLSDLFEGGLGLGPQIVTFRRINPIKAKTDAPWRITTRLVLADLAQLLDPQLERSRAERIAADAVSAALPLVKAWLQ